MKRRALALGLALLALALAEVVWGLRFETNDDLAFSWVMWGRQGMAGQGDFFLFFRGGLGQLLCALHQWLGPHAYPGFEALLVTLAMGRWFQWVLQGDPAEPGGRRRVALAGIGAAVLAAVLWKVNFTRVAILGAYLPTCVLLHGRLEGLPRRRGELFDLALVAAAFLIRPLAAMMGLALALLQRLTRSPDRRALTRWLALVALLGAYVWGTDRLQTTDLEREYAARVPYIDVLLNKGMVPPAPADLRTRVRLDTIRQWFLFDDAIFHTRYLEEILPPLRDLQWLTLQDPGGKARLALQALRTAGSVGGLLLLLWLLAEQAVAGGRRRLGATLFEVAAVVLGLVLLGILFWSRPRVIEPVFATALLGLLARLATDADAPGRGARAGVVLALVLGHLAWTWNARARERHVLGLLAERTHHEARVMETALAGRRVLATRGIPFERLLERNRPYDIRFPARSLEVIPLQGWLTQFPAYHAQIDRLGGGPGAGVAGLLEDIYRSPERYAMVGEPQPIRAFLTYARVEYGVALGAAPFQVEGVTLYRLAPAPAP